MSNRVQVINEVSTNNVNWWNLCFQWCLYVYDDGTNEYGYRFIYRRPNGSLQPARGQARIPSVKILRKLIDEAKKQGWGNYDANNI
jgi:hypothetical protein